MRRTLLRTAFLLPLVALAAPPAGADDVHLTNGRAFYGVVAEVQGDKVAIRLPDGIIRLPANRVARIERSETRLEQYLLRRHALSERQAPAADWLELARWARDEGFNTAYRESARRAADLDPQADGLKPLMRDLGWVFDPAADRWLDETVVMQRRGLVRYDGAWVTPAEQAAARTRSAEADAIRLDAQRQAWRDAAELALAARRLAVEERQADQVPTYAAAPVVSYGIGFWAPPLVVDRGGHHRRHDDGKQVRPPRRHQPPAQTRPSGDRHNHGGMQPFRASDWLPGKLSTGAAPPPGRLGPTARP